jgi:hypothetical protein
MEPSASERCSTRVVRICLIAICGLLLVPSALAKDFGPGDLRVCGRHRCVSITNRPLLRLLSSYYYGGWHVHKAAPVRRGTPGFVLRFRDDHASGMAAGPELKRFRAYGFYCGRFEHGKWYRFPARAGAALKKLTAGMQPLRVSAPPPSC